MDAQHVFVLIPKPLSHTNHDRLRNNTQKSVKMYIMRYYTGTRLIDHHCIYSNHVKSFCFQQVHWLSVASRICRHSRQVTSTALWQPNQMRQETTANDIFCTNSCSVQLQLGNVSTTGGDCLSSCNSDEFSRQMPVLQGADGPALRIKGRTRNQCGD